MASKFTNKFVNTELNFETSEGRSPPILTINSRFQQFILLGMPMRSITEPSYNDGEELY
jgi:hypothetical protein